MPSSHDDLRTHALSTTDFYALLDLPVGTPAGETKALDRAWRKTALKYHPDKVGPDNVDAQEKFHLANIGYEILSDPTLRELYDRTRAARAQKERQRALLAEDKRLAREDLEARERTAAGSASRSFNDWYLGAERIPGTESEEERTAREIRRIAEDGRRRREAMAERWRQEQAAAAAAQAQASEGGEERVIPGNAPGRPRKAHRDRPAPAYVVATEADRTVRVRFVRAGAAADLDAPRVELPFASMFGPVEYAFALKDKKAKTSNAPANTGLAADGRERDVLGVVALTFRSLLGATAAVDQWQRLQAAAAALAATGDEAGSHPLWAQLESVSWAAGNEPEAVHNWAMSGDATACASRGGSPFVGTEEGGPSLEEVVLMRLRRAELQRLAAKTPRAQEAAEIPSSKPRAEQADIRKLKGQKPRFSFSPGATPAKAATAAPRAREGILKGKSQSDPSLEELKRMRFRHEERRRLAAEALAAEDEDEDEDEQKGHDGST